VFDKSPIKFDRQPRVRLAQPNYLHQVARIVVESLDPLGDERGKDPLLFVLCDAAMDTGREDDPYVEWVDAARDQSADDKIYDLSGSDLTRRVGNNDQYGLAIVCYLFYCWCPDRFIKSLTDLNVGKRQTIIGRTEDLKSAFVVCKWNVAGSPPQVNDGHGLVSCPRWFEALRSGLAYVECLGFVRESFHLDGEVIDPKAVMKFRSDSLQKVRV